MIDSIQIPLVQAQLGQTFAGATLQNGNDRGIVVNIDGDNRNVWVRRATLCHELGHLLWDSIDQLRHLHVDRYEDLQTHSESGIEARANAFAIAFLAPPKAVEEIVKQGLSAQEQVGLLMEKFGLAATAARYHLSNVSRESGSEVDTSNIRVDLLPHPGDDWNSSENWTSDFFLIEDVPIDRRGRFAGLVAAAAKRNLVSIEYAAICLGVTPAQLEDKLDTIISIVAPDFT